MLNWLAFLGKYHLVMLYNLFICIQFAIVLMRNIYMLCYAMLSHFSHVQLCVTP